MSSFFHMGGYGVFIWSAYGVAAIVMVGLVVQTLSSLRKLDAQHETLSAAKQRMN